MGKLRRRSIALAIPRALLAWGWIGIWWIPFGLAKDAGPPLALVVIVATLAALLWFVIIRPIRARTRLAAWLRLRKGSLYFPWLFIALSSLIALLISTVTIHEFLTSRGLLPGVPPNGELFAEDFLRHPAGIVTYTLTLAVVGPLLEELGFRGWMQHELEHSVGLTTAILIPAIIFSVSHGTVVAVHHLPFAIFAGWVVWRTGSIWPAVAIHVMNNAFVVVVRLSIGGGAEQSEGVSQYWPYALVVGPLTMLILVLAARQIDRKASLDRPLRHHPHSWWARLGRPAPPASNA